MLRKGYRRFSSTGDRSRPGGTGRDLSLRVHGTNYAWRFYQKVDVFCIAFGIEGKILFAALRPSPEMVQIHGQQKDWNDSPEQRPIQIEN